jgi:methyl-accepting chemotaxis protein
MLAFKNYNLGTKLNLILVGILISTIVACGVFLSYVLKIKTEREVADKAFLIIETMNSVRSYTNSQVKPELAARLATESNFIPETVPAYSAREVFEGLRQQAEYENFFYKEATLNPTNLRDKADEFETEITEQFRQDKQLKELTGFRLSNGENLYYIARPLAIKKTSCLECHSTPEKAPANLINTYGKEHGFGWKLDEIVASQIVSVPAGQVYSAARRLQLLVIGIFAVFFIIAIALTNLFLNQSIIQPIKHMAALATKISTGELDLQFQHDNKDEIGSLATSLNRMILSLQMAINMIDSDEQ